MKLNKGKIFSTNYKDKKKKIDKKEESIEVKTMGVLKSSNIEIAIRQAKHLKRLRNKRK